MSVLDPSGFIPEDRACGDVDFFTSTFFSNGNIKEELLKTVQLRGQNRGAENFYASLLSMSVHIPKLMSVITNGSSAMTSENVGFIGL